MSLVVRKFKGNISKERDNKNERCCNLCICNKIEKIEVIHFKSFLSIAVVIAKNTIPSIIFCVNTAIAFGLRILVKLGVISTRANQVAERFPVTEDVALSNARRFVFVTI